MHRTHTKYRTKLWHTGDFTILSALPCQHALLMCANTHTHPHRAILPFKTQNSNIYQHNSRLLFRFFCNFYYKATDTLCHSVSFNVFSYCICHRLETTEHFLSSMSDKFSVRKGPTTERLSIQSLKMPCTNWQVKPCLICNANKTNKDSEF